nr:reverse transcriptase domain-containing protein [Tanacetum cinerariifolium]
MSTRSSARNLFPPLDNPELTIRRRSRADPTLLNDFEISAEGNDDPPVPDLRTMEELCQTFLNGRGGPIASIAIQATKNSINTFEQMAKMFLGKYFPPSMVTRFRNEITNFCQHPDESLFEAWERYKLSIDRCPNHNMLPVTQIDTFYNGLTLRHRDTINAAASGTFMKRPLKAKMAEINKNLMRVLQPSLAKPRTYMLREPIKVIPTNLKGNNQGRNQFFQGASHGQNLPPDYQAPAYQASGYQALVHQPPIPQPQVATTNEFTNFMKANDSILKNMQTNMTSLTNSKLELKNMFGQFLKMNTASSSGSGTLPIERETEVTKDTVPPTNNGSTKDVQPSVVQTQTPILNSEPVVAPIIEPVVAPVSAPKPNQKHLIPYPSRLHDQKLHDKANDQREKNFQIFKELNFNISFADALIVMPNPGRSRRKHKSHAIINMEQALSSKLSPMCMTLKLADRLIYCLVGVVEDVFVKVGTFHFPVNFIVVDFDVDPRVPLILERSFLKTRRALIDVFKGELTLHVGKEAITFNLNQTSRYSANYNDMRSNQIDVIDMDCEEYSQEVLGFSDVIASGNPTPYYDPIVFTSSSTLTPFGDSDFLLKEVYTF